MSSYIQRSNYKMVSSHFHVYSINPFGGPKNGYTAGANQVLQVTVGAWIVAGPITTITVFRKDDFSEAITLTGVATSPLYHELAQLPMQVTRWYGPGETVWVGNAGDTTEGNESGLAAQVTAHVAIFNIEHSGLI